MARYFAMTSRGLVDVLRDELMLVGAKELQKEPGGVFFDGNWGVVVRANLKLRTATRIVRPLFQFPAYKNDELYGNIHKHDFSKYLDVDGTLVVDASVRDCSFKDQRFVAMKVKDAIVDQFREKTGRRPSVDKERPDLSLIVRGYKNQFDVSIDTSGDALFKRGYRRATGDAPLKEHLAAGILRMTEWDLEMPIVDPMCGSGTLLIEAALMKKRTAPGLLRKHFAFMKLKGFDKEILKRELDQIIEEELEIPEGTEPTLFGYDVDQKALKAARENARAAGVDDMIVFKRHPMETLEAPAPKGIVVTNPPYGARMGEKELLQDTYKDLAFTLKNRFKGWSAFIISGDPELSQFMKLKATRRVPVWNGPIECRLLRYDLY